MSAPVKKCEVCDDTGSKSRDMGGDMDCTACNAAIERMVMRNKLGLTWGDDDAWRAYQLGKAAAAPVVPVAAQPVVPEGFQLVPTEINAVLAMGWAYLDAARENDPGQHYSFNHAGWRALLERAKEYQPTAAPLLEAQPAGEVERDAARYRWLCKTAFDSSMTQEQINKEVDASMAQGEKP